MKAGRLVIETRASKAILTFLLLLSVVFSACRVEKEPGRVWNLRGKVTRLAVDLIGIPYLYGGYDITGFDCSGFVYYVFSCFGIELPRTAKKQGKVKRKVPLKQAKPGDILVFKLKSGWHSGIYTGNNFFVHAPNRGVRVRREYLSRYWLSRLKAVVQIIDG